MEQEAKSFFEKIIKTKHSFVFSLFLIVFLTTLLIASLGYSFAAKRVPLAIAVPTLLLTIYALFRMNMEPEKEDFKRFVQKDFIQVLWIFALGLSILLFGYHLGACIFTFVLLKLKFKESYVFSIVYAIIIFLITYVILHYGMRWLVIHYGVFSYFLK